MYPYLLNISMTIQCRCQHISWGKYLILADDMLVLENVSRQKLNWLVNRTPKQIVLVKTVP